MLMLALALAGAPEELGHVDWHRGYDDARALATAQNKPLLILFDEVPGCSTVLDYGRGPLTHPLLVEAAETLFVPVVVYNNIEGPDREALTRYNEPTWNNPVVRIVTPQTEKERVPRLTDRSEGALAAAMRDALDTPPLWLSTLAEELTVEAPNTSLYSMYCFWSGEAHFAAAQGVVATRTGFANGAEVVEVTWDPARTNAKALDAHAQAGKARPSQGALRPSESDDRYSLRQTQWASVPMTALQASRANAWIAQGRDPSPLFSPRQHAMTGADIPSNLGRGDLRDAFAAHPRR